MTQHKSRSLVGPSGSKWQEKGALEWRSCLWEELKHNLERNDTKEIGRELTDNFADSPKQQGQVTKHKENLKGNFQEDPQRISKRLSKKTSREQREGFNEDWFWRGWLFRKVFELLSAHADNFGWLIFRAYIITANNNCHKKPSAYITFSLSVRWSFDVFPLKMFSRLEFIGDKSAFKNLES